MILPNKYLREKDSLIGIGGFVLQSFSSSISLSTLWVELKESKNVDNYHRFILTLDLLYMLDLIEIRNNVIYRCSNNDL